MSYSDEQQRTIRGMQLLGLSFPPDLKRTAETIEELPIEYMLRIKRMFREEYDVYNRVFESLSKRIVFPYCHICEKEEMAYDDFPEGWGWYDGQVSWYLMCNECQARYKKRFGHEPEIIYDFSEEMSKNAKYGTKSE